MDTVLVGVTVGVTVVVGTDAGPAAACSDPPFVDEIDTGATVVFGVVLDTVLFDGTLTVVAARVVRRVV